MKILLIEDELAHFETFSNVLDDLDPVQEVSLIWARTDKKAIEKLKSTRFDLIIMDVSLKGSQFNGIELTRVFRREFAKQIPIVTYSISRDPKDKEDSLAAGANLYIRKPFNYHEMIQTISSLLDQVQKGELVVK